MSTKRILVTGSRHFSHRDLVAQALEAVELMLAPSPDGFTLVHGDAAGLDRLSAEVTRLPADHIEAHPADWTNLGKRAGFVRNQHMLDLGADVCLAFPLHTQQTTGKDTSRGTWDMATRARDAGVPTLVIWRQSVFAYGQAGQQLLAEQVALGPSRMAANGSIPLHELILPF